jgi:hypothetical protein
VEERIEAIIDALATYINKITQHFFTPYLATKNQLTFKHPDALTNVSSSLISSLPSSIIHHPKAILSYTSYIITSFSYSSPWQHLQNSKTT